MERGEAPRPSWLPRRSTVRASSAVGADASRPPEQRVDVVLPIFGAEQHLARLLPSLLEHSDLARHRVVAILDGPQPAGVEERLDAFAAAAGGAFVRLEHDRNRGYAAAANSGMRMSDERDVILLNSDVVVTRGWVEKLQLAAYSAPEIATVTPLSNRATICSVPIANVDNDLPGGFDVESFGELVESVSRREYPRLPTGVGMCLYVKRAALLDVGLFDEEAFREGYGEESDFCFRALSAGWAHVADDATFVFHAGRGSFGARRLGLAARAGGVMQKRHPEYYRTIARFLAADPLRDVRRRILDALEARAAPVTVESRPKVLHVVHGFPPHDHGGVELYAYWLARKQASERPTAVYARFRDEGAASGEVVESIDGRLRVRRVVNNFDQRDPLARNALYDRRLERDFQAFLQDVAPDLVHVHHLAGHMLALGETIRRSGVPLVLQLQDWWTVCARANLLDALERPCGGPGLLRCGACLPLTRVRPRRATNAALYLLRRTLANRLLARANARVAGSPLVIESLRRIGILRDAPVELLPYGVPIADEAGISTERRPPAPPLRFGFIGSILPHKGLHVAAAACADLPPGSATLEVWGDSGFAPEYTNRVRRLAGSADIRFHGRFEESERRSILQELDVLLVPSLGLESFGLVAWEAMHCGVPVVCSDRVPVAREVIDGAFGASYPAQEASALARVLRGLVADPSVVVEWRKRLPRVKTWSAHAEEIEALYDRLLASRR